MESSHAIICPNNIIGDIELIAIGTIVNSFKLVLGLYDNNMPKVTMVITT